MKGARKLGRRGLAVLRELVPWRETIAAELDRAIFRVISNEALLALSEAPPRSHAELEKIGGISPRLVAERGESLLAVVERGLDGAGEGPAAVPARRAARGGSGVRSGGRAAQGRAQRGGGALGLDPGVLCPKGTLEAVARARPKSAAALGEIPEVRGWQVEVLGGDFLKALGN